MYCHRCQKVIPRYQDAAGNTRCRACDTLSWEHMAHVPTKPSQLKGAHIRLDVIKRNPDAFPKESHERATDTV